MRIFYLRTILIIFLPINLNMCFGCSKEPSHRDGSFEYPQHMFWVRIKEIKFLICTLIWRPVYNAMLGVHRVGLCYKMSHFTKKLDLTSKMVSFLCKIPWSKIYIQYNLFYLNLSYNEVSYKGSGRANPGSEFVVANYKAKWKKLELIEFDFSQGFSQKASRNCYLFKYGIFLKNEGIIAILENPIKSLDQNAYWQIFFFFQPMTYM